MDGTLAQILSELFKAHQTIDALRAEVVRLTPEPTTAPPEPPKEAP